MTNPYAWLFLSALTIFSVVFGVWSWCAGKQRKEISIEIKSDILIKAGKQQIKKLDVRYDGNPIADLTSSKFYIWNSGNQVLQCSDIVTARPMMIQSSNAVILDAQIIMMNEDTNAFKIRSTTDHQVIIEFEYFEGGDGVVVQVLHTGDALNLEFDCKIKGGNEIRDCTTAHKNRKVSLRDKFWDFVANELSFIILNVCLLFGVFLGQFVFHVESGSSPATTQMIGFLGIIIVCCLCGIMLSKKIRKFAKNVYNRSIPPSLLSTNKE